jgi:hypothetical protein
MMQGLKQSFQCVCAVTVTVLEFLDCERCDFGEKSRNARITVVTSLHANQSDKSGSYFDILLNIDFDD